MGEAAAHGPAGAHRAVGDSRGGAAQEAVRRVRYRAVLDRGMGGERADPHPVRVLGDLAQSRDPRDVDQQRRAARRKLSIGPRDWPPAIGRASPAAAPSSFAASATLPAAREVERGRLHRSPARSSAAKSRRGVIGVSAISTPKARSASLTALPMAAGGPIAPDSPTPLMPRVEYGEGDSM